MKTTIALFLCVTGFALGAVDVPPPTSGSERWMRADVRAKLPSTVVLAAAPREIRGGVALEVLPGPSCRLAVAALRDHYRVHIDGREIDPGRPVAGCSDARVHRIVVRA